MVPAASIEISPSPLEEMNIGAGLKKSLSPTAPPANDELIPGLFFNVIVEPTQDCTFPTLPPWYV